MDYPWNNSAIWHAMNVHLPIVLAVLGLPLVCIIAITRGRSRALRWGTVAFYFVVTVSAWFAEQTGERAIRELPPTLPQAAWDRINFHEWMAAWVWVLAGATTLLLLFSNLPRRWARQTFTTLALVMSVATVGWISVTAHSGGVAVYEHGLGTVAMHNSPSGSPTAQADSRTRERAVSPTTQVAPSAIIAPITQSISYAKDIKPLLATKCAECHAGAELKGNFDVSSVASIVKGGKKAGAGLVHGKPDDSSIVQYIEGKKQPQMPKGGKPLAEKDIALIKAWIAGGAIEDPSATVVQAPAAPAPAAAAPAAVPAAAVPASTPAPAPAAAPAPVAKVEEVISPEWDPQVKFNADESVAVRRFVRMQNLPPAPQPPKVSGKTFNVIDQFIVAKWPAPQLVSADANPQASATQPADEALCDDPTFVRRVYLDLIGVIPTADEARKFVADKDEKKREKLVDALLARPKDYAAHWVPFWEDALCSNGLHQGGVGTHGNYRDWIIENFQRNKPYDTMVQELLDPAMPNHPPRYVLNDTHMRTLQSAADTAQVFLGTAIKCASCHSHFLNDEWPQARATAYSGFFSDKDMELVRCERQSGQFAKTHFMFDLPKAPTSAPSDQNARLKRVAQLITDPTNPRFAKTLVNRLWKRYMGLGFFEPADDYREDTPPSHPELLAWLADDFMRNGYDIKHTIRLILTSRTYQLRYDPALEDKFVVEKPKDPRYYRSPGLRRLTAEQLLDSINVALGQKLPERRAYQDDNSTPLTRSLGKPAARNEVSTQRPDDTAVVQALELLNGKEFHDRIYKGDLITTAAVQPKVETLVDDIYWSALGRAPSAKEKDAAVAFVKSAPPPATTQPVEVVWVEDAVPTSAKPVGAWKFAAAPDQPVFSGKLSHTEAETAPVQLQHLFSGAKFPVSPKDVLFTYVYIDAANPPKEIMLQFHTGKDWSRACWGEDVIPFKPKTNLGPLPKAGGWVRLDIPAEKIGFDKPDIIDGISFDQFGGKVYWDKSGAMKGPPVNDPETVGDMLWALITNPEFQYIK
jgi:uncharacterized membrane protein/mono/diheme cytochrome c family protein